MWLIVGLGNPGKKYQITRHNIGFLSIDNFVAGCAGGSLPAFKSDHKAQLLKFELEGEQIIVAKPQTYMNLSGESVIEIMNYYKIPQENLVVIHDEADLPYQRVKIQKNRGPGGHNGLRSINQHLGNQDYGRIKLGVGRPDNPHMEVADFLLSPFSKSEQDSLPDFLNLASEVIESYIFEGLEKTSSQFNQKRD